MMSIDLAKKLSDELNDILGRLDITNHWVKSEGSEEDFEWHKKLIAPVMTSVVLDYLNKLYFRYPDAKPKNYD